MNEKDIFEKFKKDHNQSFDKSTQEENYLNIINKSRTIMFDFYYAIKL